MKFYFSLIILLLTGLTSFADKADTIPIKPGDLDINKLQTGSYQYLIYFKQTKQSPAQGMTLVKINVKPGTYHNKPVFTIQQEWDRDTVIHSANSVFDAKDFSTIVHDTYWKSIGYSMKFDFEAKTVDFQNRGKVLPDSLKQKAIADFKESFNRYNLNWHEDLVIYQLLSYKENRTFVINYSDPGFGKAENVLYTVTGSAVLTGHDGKKIDCWVLSHIDHNGSERYWISKQSKEVLMEEDFSGKTYRYKIKMSAIGD